MDTVSTITRLRNARSAEAPEEVDPVGVTLVKWVFAPWEAQALARWTWHRAKRRAVLGFVIAVVVALMAPLLGLIAAVLAGGVLFGTWRRYRRELRADGELHIGTGGVMVNGVVHRWERWGATARPAGPGGRWELVLDWEDLFGESRLIVEVPLGCEGQALALMRWYH